MSTGFMSTIITAECYESFDELVVKERLVLGLAKEKAMYSWCDGDNGNKKPLSRKELDKRYHRRENKNKGFTNPCILCGFFDNDETGILSIDVDDNDKYEEWIRENNIDREEVEDTYGEISPSGSRHYYYRVGPEFKELTVGTNFPYNKMDYRCMKGYCLTVGSVYTCNMCKKTDPITKVTTHRCGASSDETCNWDGHKYLPIGGIFKVIRDIPTIVRDIFLSRIDENKKSKEKAKKIKLEEDEVAFIEQHSKHISDHDHYLASISLRCLDPTKYEDREKWLYIASMIKSLGLDWTVFHNFSIRCSNHSPCTCKSVFGSCDAFFNYHVALDKICDMAICDNISLYKKLNYMTEEDVMMLYNDNRPYPSYDMLNRTLERSLLGCINVILNSSAYVYLKHKPNKYKDDDNTYVWEINELSKYCKSRQNKKLYYISDVLNPVTKDYIYPINLNDYFLKNKRFLYNGTYCSPIIPFDDTSVSNEYALNTFTPYVAQRLRNYDVSKIEPILKLINDVWCNGDAELYKYTLSWLHQIFKYPDKPNHVALVLHGDMGAGKSSLFVGINAHILGSHCFTKVNLEQAFSRFNSFLENKLIVTIEEPNKLKNQSQTTYENELKDFITCSTATVERKFENMKEIDVFHNLVITCNDLSGIPVTDSRDRRYFILDCKVKYDAEYYNTLFNEYINNKDVMQIFFNYIYDLSDVIDLKRTKIPWTDIKRECLNEHRSTTELFIEGEFHLDYQTLIDLHGAQNSTDTLYMDYIEWCKDMGEHSYKIEKKNIFFKNMRRYGTTERKRFGKERGYAFSFNNETLTMMKRELETGIVVQPTITQHIVREEVATSSACPVRSVNVTPHPVANTVTEQVNDTRQHPKMVYTDKFGNQYSSMEEMKREYKRLQAKEKLKKKLQMEDTRKEYLSDDHKDGSSDEESDEE
jgi:hypothetical protein